VPDVRPYVDEALALVVPLRSGGGTRLKILEAMAMGRPVVSTALGAEGLEIAPGENILLAETAEQFLQQLQTLIDHPDRARQLGQAGRQLVVAQYDWPICLRGLTGLYETLMSRATR
jgi:glycosyltransferase involved in cell wall biosynthesis